MYEDFYGLKEKPFSLTPDPKFLFLSSNHRQVMEHLNFAALQKEGFILITGEIGTGKTTICRALLNRLDEKTAAALLLNPFSSEEELLRYILTDLGVPPSGQTRLELLEQLSRFLLDRSARGGISVLIIDEAQNLSLSLLEQIRILSNLETEKEKLLQIILVGQEELREKLKLRKLRQLDQRISVRYHLRPLEPKETAQYVYHRLMVAGSDGRISFSGGAMKEIFRFSQGTPRLINIICDRALLNGYVKEAYQITAPMVREAAGTLRDGGRTRLGASKWKAGAALAVGLLAVGGLISVLFLRDLPQAWKSYVPSSSFPWGREGKANPPPPAEKGNPPEKPPAGPKVQSYVFDKSFPYTLHVGSFPTEKAALEVVLSLESLPYPKYISMIALPEGVRSYRVLVGKFKTQGEALEVQAELNTKRGFGTVKVMEVVGEG